MSNANGNSQYPYPQQYPNYCVKCGTAIPKPLTVRTVCTKCAVPIANWFDFDTMEDRPYDVSPSPPTQTSQQNGSQYHNAGLGERFETISLNDRLGGERRRKVNENSVEERFFLGALLVLEGHFQRPQTYMGKAMVEVKKMIASTLEMSLNKADVRETLAKNVSIWMRLKRIFYFGVPLCERRSLSSSHHESTTGPGQEVTESASLILKHSTYLCEDLHLLNSLLVISRNMLAIKETAQEICAAVGFDGEVKRLIELCVQVTSKGYDGENVVNEDRNRLMEVTELYKKVLVTCLQHTHNWTMGNDRFKMSFWFDMLFDDEWRIDAEQELLPEDLHIRTMWIEVRNWLARHSRKDPVAQELLDKYESEVNYGVSPGMLPNLDGVSGKGHLTLPESVSPVWKHEEKNKIEQDRLYARVSHEIDIWWKTVRDKNYDGWVVPMETVEGAKERAEICKEKAIDRCIPQRQDHEYEHSQDPEGYEDEEVDPDHDAHSLQAEQGDDLEGEEEEEDDDDEYVEGPLRGLLTEIPNILDTKQIEALHMTVKACVVDSMGSGLTPAGENLQKTRCKMFLALDCGKNLLREMLVFIAVWEQNDAQFIFQITAQIIESFHHNALLPYAWESLRIQKDIVSPAQTVLLRLINYMFRARKDSPIYDDLRDYNRDAKLIHFLYNYFRCRVVPDCIALISAQTEIRLGKRDPVDFPVDLWDMERAKDGLSQYLDFISVVAEIAEMRPLLIEWEAVYELIALLKALEQGVARKSIDDRPLHQNGQPQPPHANLPPLHDTPHKFPWSGIKIQLLIILTSLLSPTSPRRTGPGNPIVQQQLLTHDGLMPLLNCCVYDGHNEYLKERATLAIKFAMEGCMEAQNYVKELVPVRQAQQKRVEQQQRELEGLRGVMRTVGEYREMWGGGLQGVPPVGERGSVEEEEYDDEGSEGEEFVEGNGTLEIETETGRQRRQGDVAFVGPGTTPGAVERRR